MSTIKNGESRNIFILIRSIKCPGTSFQSTALNQNHLRNVCHTAQHTSIGANFILIVLRIQKKLA